MLGHELHLRLSEEESVELYITLLDAIRHDDARRLPSEIFDIVGKLQRRMADYEITEHLRLYHSLTCHRCQKEGFATKQKLVHHVVDCYGVTVEHALVVIHNLFRPALILKGRL